VPANHPLRSIRGFVDPILRELSPVFDTMYARTGRPSIPPEQLLRALLVQVLYRSSRCGWADTKCFSPVDILRARFRNSFSRPESITPNQVARLKIPLGDSSVALSSRPSAARVLRSWRIVSVTTCSGNRPASRRSLHPFPVPSRSAVVVRIDTHPCSRLLLPQPPHRLRQTASRLVQRCRRPEPGLTDGFASPLGHCTGRDRVRR
jgi:hypothetical protein